jgi:hypothetical protein
VLGAVWECAVCVRARAAGGLGVQAKMPVDQEKLAKLQASVSRAQAPAAPLSRARAAMAKAPGLAAYADAAVAHWQVRTGGKGSVRRKKKAVHKTASADDKRLQVAPHAGARAVREPAENRTEPDPLHRTHLEQGTLKRLGVNNIPGIEEVNLFRDNGSVIHFKNPKVRRARFVACYHYILLALFFRG